MWIQIKLPIIITTLCRDICFLFSLKKKQIRDGDSVLSPMLTGLLCGYHEAYEVFYPLMSFSSQSNQVMVKFVTDESGTAHGFNMTWTAGQLMSRANVHVECDLLGKKTTYFLDVHDLCDPLA